MKKIVVFLLVVALIGGIAFAEGQGEESGTITLRAGTMLAKNQSFSKGLEYFSKRIAEETDGKVIVEVYTDGVLGSELEMLESIQVGTIDMCVNSPAYIGNNVPEYQIYELPFLFSSREHRDAVVNGPIGAEIDKNMEEKLGVKVLGHFGGIGRILISQNKKIETLDDIKKVKMRVYASPMVVATWEALGTLPVTVAYAEVYTALQTGVADLAENETSTLITQRWYEPSKYIAMTEHNINTRPFIISAEKFEALPSDIQEIFIRVGKETADYAVKLEREDDAKYISQLKDFGIEINELRDKDKWIAATRDLRVDFVNKYNLGQILSKIENAAK